MTTELLDVKGLNCPLPLLRAKKSLSRMASGDILQVVATDPGSVRDFEAFCSTTGHQLLASGERGGVFEYTIKKK